MHYTDKATAFKIGVLQKCAELQLDDASETIIFGLLEKLAEDTYTNPLKDVIDASVASMPTPNVAGDIPKMPPTVLKDAPSGAAAAPVRPSEISNPADLAPASLGSTMSQFGADWRDNPWGMVGKSLPYMLGGGLLGGLAGGGRGALLGGAAGLLGPAAQEYFKQRGVDKNLASGGGSTDFVENSGEMDQVDADLVAALASNPTASENISPDQAQRILAMADKEPYLFANETAKANIANLRQRIGA